jgi:hypothetical protein
MTTQIRRAVPNTPSQFNQPLVSKQEWIEAGLFIKLAPQLCDILGVSMQYVANARMRYRDDPDFPVGAPYSIHAVKFHSIQDYLDAGIFDKPIAQVAREMGVGPDAVAAARAKIRRDPPPGIDLEILKYRTPGPRVRTQGPKRRGPKPQIVERETLLRALLTCYNWKQVQEKLKISREVFLRSVKHHGFEQDAYNIKQAYRD